MKLTEEHFILNPIENKKTFDVSSVTTAFYYTYKPNFKPRYEKYDVSQLFLVLEGEGTYITEDAQYHFCPGELIYRPAGKSSMYSWDSDSVRFALISFVCRSDAMAVFDGKPITLYEEEVGIFLDVVKTLVRICVPVKDDDQKRGMMFKEGVPDVVLGFISSSLERFLSMVYCRLKGIELLTDESQKVSVYRDSSQLVHEVKAYLAANAAKQLTLADICKAFRISQTSLTNKFRRETDRGVMEYFTMLKISEAKRRIREETSSFTEISESLGFSSSTYFSKVFKKETGMTPTEYSKYVSKRRII